MAKRSYDQSCGLATALDILGERWTMLILRDLVLGPQRYTDLLEGLPGIGTNLLASRLRDLEGLGLLRRRELPPPAASTVYELTEEARDLEPAMGALARWGARYMALPESAESASPRMMILGLASTFTPEQALRLDGRRYELRASGMQFELWFEGGRALVRQQPSVRPDAVLEIEPATLFAIAAKRLSPAEAEQGGLLSIEGDRQPAELLLGSLDVSFIGDALREPAAAAARH